MVEAGTEGEGVKAPKRSVKMGGEEK